MKRREWVLFLKEDLIKWQKRLQLNLSRCNALNVSERITQHLKIGRIYRENWNSKNIVHSRESILYTKRQRLSSDICG